MEEQRAIDSDDPEYQSVFAALNELGFSSLKTRFKEKCFRDNTLSFVEEKEELKGILKKELELPFGQTFEFSRLWFKKYHGKEGETKKEEKGDLDSDDPEYQSVFAALNELGFSSLKPLFKEKCFRDKTLSFIEEKEELKGILQEELELPFGPAFEFSRLWFRKSYEKEEGGPDLPLLAVQTKRSKRNLQEAEKPSFEAVKEWPAKGKHDIHKQVGQEATLDRLEMVPASTEQRYAYSNVKDGVQQRVVSDMSTTKTTTQNEYPVGGQLVETKQGKQPSRSVMLKADHSNAMGDKFNLENADPLQQEENDEPLADHSGRSAENTEREAKTYVPLEPNPSQDYTPPPPENNDDDHVVKADSSDQQQETVSSANEKERESEERPEGEANQSVNQLSQSRSKSKKKKNKKSSTGTSNASTEGIAESKMEIKEEKKGKVPLEDRTFIEVAAAEATSASDSVTLPVNTFAPRTISFQNSLWEGMQAKEEGPDLPPLAVQTKQSKCNLQEAEKPSFEAVKEWPAKCKHDIHKQVGQEATLDRLEMVPASTEQRYAYSNVKDGVQQRVVSDMSTTQTTTQNEYPVGGQLVETKQGKQPNRSVMLKAEHSNAIGDEINLENADSLQQEENNEPLADHSGHSAENTQGETITYVPLEPNPSQDYTSPPPENNDDDHVVKADSSDQQQETVSSANEKERKGEERPEGEANQSVNQLSQSRSKSKKKKNKKSSIGTSNARTEGIAESKMEIKEEKKSKVPLEDRTSVKDNIEPAAKGKEEFSTNGTQDGVPLLSTASWNTPKPEKALSNQDRKRNVDEKLNSKETNLGNGTLDGKKVFSNLKRCTPRSRGVEGRLVSYEKGCVLDVEENREVEFKSLVNAYPSSLPWKIMEKAKKFICACLNANRKGIIYFGVGDNQEGSSKYQHGEILGLDVDALKDDINKAFQNLLNDHIISDAGPLQKGGEQNCVDIHYVPVTKNECRSNFYVVEIEVIRDWGFCRDHIYYSKLWTAKRGGDFAGKKALNDFYKVKDEFDEVAIRTNGASCCVKQVNVDRDVKKPLEVKYKEWRQTTKKGAREIPDELGLEEADVRRLSVAVRKRLCELNRKEYGYVLVANKVPAQYRGTAHLSFLQNIPCVAVFDLFDPSSKQDGLHFACNEMTDAPRANIRTLDDFKDVTPDKDSFVSTRGTTWILSNEDMQTEGWIKCSKDCIWRALSAYKQCFNPGRLLFVFLSFSETAVEEMADIIECSFSILGNMAGSCVTILSEGRSATDAIINSSKPSLRKELAGCSITGITWSLLKEIVREMVEPSKFEERGATTDLPYYNGYLKEVPIKTVLSMDDLEVYCPNPRLPTSAEAIAKERDAFYKGAQASQMNLYHEHSIPRSLEGKVNTKLEKALNSLSKESIDANYYVKTVTVSYEPGAGATTLCRRIIWSKRNEYRCALVKAITQSTDFQIDKLQNMGYDEMNKIYSLPVLVLVDNFPEGDVRLLTEHIMKRQTKCVLLTTLPISKSVSDSKFEITVGKLDEEETSLVKDILITITDDNGRRLEAEKVLERERRFIWFGLELFGREYLKIKERLQNHIHSILSTLRNDSGEEPQMLLDMCCFLNKYSDGSIILPNSLVLDFLYERNSLEQPRLQDVHDIFGGILLEEQNETHGYYGWRPAHSLVSEVVTSRITSVDTARRSLEIICKGKAYVVKSLRHQVFRMFLERKRLSDPVLMEEQAVDDRAAGFDIENEVFGFYGKRTKYSCVIVDILGEENNVEGALSVLLEICEQATQTEDKSYAWQQLARFIGYEMRANDMNKQTDLLERLHKAMMKERRIEFRMPERGIDAAHIAIDIAVSNQPTFANHYTTKGVLYLIQLTDLKTSQSRSVPEGIEICRKALSVYDKALEASRKPNHFAMIGKIQAIISLLEIVKDLPCFQPDGMFMAYLKKEKILPEMQEVLSNEDQDYVQNLSQTTLDILNELFGNIKLKQSTTYDENEIRSLKNAKIRASNIRRKFYEITKFDKMELSSEDDSMSLSSTTSQDLTFYQQKVQDILFIRDETPYSTWSNLSDSDVDRIYQMLKIICVRGHGSHNDMLICSKACLQLKNKPVVQELDKIVCLWVKKFPNSVWAHLFYYMIHFPVPNGSLAPCNVSTKESIKRCIGLVQEKAGSGFKKSGAEYFLGKGKGLDAIISGHEFQRLQTKWKTKTEFWRGRETTERLERVKGQKDLGSKGIISYQGIQLHFDNTLYPNESKDDLWFYVGFTFAGPYAYDPVDKDTYMSLTNANHGTRRKLRSSHVLLQPRVPWGRASAREHEVDETTRTTNLDNTELSQTNPQYTGDRNEDGENDWVVVGENKLNHFPHRSGKIKENKAATNRFEAERSETKLENVKNIVGTRGTGTKQFNLTCISPDGKVHHGAFVRGAQKSAECPRHTSWKDNSLTDSCTFAHGWKGDTLQFVCTKCTENNLTICIEKIKHQKFIWNLGPYYNRHGEVWKRTCPRPIGNPASFDSGGSASSRERTPTPVREKPMSWGSLDWSEEFRDSGRLDWFDE